MAAGDGLPEPGAQLGHAPEPSVLAPAEVLKVKHPDGSKSINGFRVLECIGEGAFGMVKLCESEETDEKFAMKVFRKGQLRRQREFVSAGQQAGMRVRTALDKVYGEVEVMRKLSHPNCVRLHGVFDESDPQGKLYLLMEYAAGGPTMEWDESRLSYVSPETNGLIPEALARQHLQDILQGLRYLHTSLIAHRDVKPQNVVLDAGGCAKLADFSVAIAMGKDCMVSGTEGTFHFYSPEMCRLGYAGHDGRKADIWAAGVTLWAFLFGSVPFFERDLLKLMERIAEAQYELPACPVLAPECSACLRLLLLPDAAERPLSDTLLREDPWCRQEGARD